MISALGFRIHGFRCRVKELGFGNFGGFFGRRIQDVGRGA